MLVVEKFMSQIRPFDHIFDKHKGADGFCDEDLERLGVEGALGTIDGSLSPSGTQPKRFALAVRRSMDGCLWRRGRASRMSGMQERTEAESSSE